MSLADEKARRSPEPAADADLSDRLPPSLLLDLAAVDELPLHQRLKNALTNTITILALPPGRRIWSESQVMARYQVSRHVVRQALAQLVLEGRLVSRKGAGHFVNGRRLHKHLPVISSITADLAASGERYSLDLIDVGLTPAIDDWEKDLAVRPAKPAVLRIRRTGMLEGGPVALVVGAYPVNFSKILTTRAVSATGVYRTLGKHGMSPHRADVVMNIDFSSAEESRWLGVSEGTPVICIRSRTRTADGALIEVTRELYRADRFEFSYEATIGAP